MGVWVGYVYSFGGCAVVVALILASTLVLYAAARFQKKSGQPHVRVVSLPPRTDQ